MEEIIIVLAGLVALFASFFVYSDLLSKDKIKPHIPPRYTKRDTRQARKLLGCRNSDVLQMASDRRA